MMAIAEGLHLRNRNPVYLELARRSFLRLRSVISVSNAESAFACLPPSSDFGAASRRDKCGMGNGEHRTSKHKEIAWAVSADNFGQNDCLRGRLRAQRRYQFGRARTVRTGQAKRRFLHGGPGALLADRGEAAARSPGPHRHRAPSMPDRRSPAASCARAGRAGLVSALWRVDPPLAPGSTASGALEARGPGPVRTLYCQVREKARLY